MVKTKQKISIKSVEDFTKIIQKEGEIESKEAFKEEERKEN